MAITISLRNTIRILSQFGFIGIVLVLTMNLSFAVEIELPVAKLIAVPQAVEPQ